MVEEILGRREKKLKTYTLPRGHSMGEELSNVKLL